MAMLDGLRSLWCGMVWYSSANMIRGHTGGRSQRCEDTSIRTESAFNGHEDDDVINRPYLVGHEFDVLLGERV